MIETQAGLLEHKSLTARIGFTLPASYPNQLIKHACLRLLVSDEIHCLPDSPKRHSCAARQPVAVVRASFLLGQEHVMRQQIAGRG